MKTLESLEEALPNLQIVRKGLLKELLETSPTLHDQIVIMHDDFVRDQGDDIKVELHLNWETKDWDIEPSTVHISFTKSFEISHSGIPSRPIESKSYQKLKEKLPEAIFLHEDIIADALSYYEKGVEALLEAAEILRKVGGPDITLHVEGRPEYESGKSIVTIYAPISISVDSLIAKQDIIDGHWIDSDAFDCNFVNPGPHLVSSKSDYESYEN